MLFDGNDYDVNMTFFEIPGSNFNDIPRQSELFSVKEGFMRGNMFRDEYKPYKNLTYLPLNPRTDREKKLYDIMGLCFAINDLNLYLDLYPDDQECYRLFKQYTLEEKKLKKEYEMMYGPLTLNQVENNKYKWLENPWPWDNEGGSMYV